MNLKRNFPYKCSEWPGQCSARYQSAVLKASCLPRLDEELFLQQLWLHNLCDECLELLCRRSMIKCYILQTRSIVYCHQWSILNLHIHCCLINEITLNEREITRHCMGNMSPFSHQVPNEGSIKQQKNINERMFYTICPPTGLDKKFQLSNWPEEVSPMNCLPGMAE